MRLYGADVAKTDVVLRTTETDMANIKQLSIDMQILISVHPARIVIFHLGSSFLPCPKARINIASGHILVADHQRTRWPECPLFALRETASLFPNIPRELKI